MAEPHADGAKALVIGYGRFGQTVAQMLQMQRISVTLIDRDPDMIDAADSFGATVYYGDGTRLDLLRQAGAADAQLLMFCLDGDVIDREMLEGVGAAFPNAAVFARAFDRRSIVRMTGGPVAGTIREVFESAVCLARLAMAHLDIDDDEIDRVEGQYRRRDDERLKQQADSGDIRAGIEKMIEQNRMLAEKAR